MLTRSEPSTFTFGFNAFCLCLFSKPNLNDTKLSPTGFCRTGRRCTHQGSENNCIVCVEGGPQIDGTEVDLVSDVFGLDAFSHMSMLDALEQFCCGTVSEPFGGEDACPHAMFADVWGGAPHFATPLADASAFATETETAVAFEHVASECEYADEPPEAPLKVRPPIARSLQTLWIQQSRRCASGRKRDGLGKSVRLAQASDPRRSRTRRGHFIVQTQMVPVYGGNFKLFRFPGSHGFSTNFVSCYWFPMCYVASRRNFNTVA